MSHRLFALIIPAAFVLTGCAKPAAVAPTEIGLTDFAIAVPASIPASMASFKVSNTGKEGHQAALVRLDSGKTYADWQAAMKDTTKGPPPKWIVWMGGAHAFPGASNEFTVPLEAGEYVWYCIIPGPDNVPHMMKGMMAPMTVTPSTAAMAAAPAFDIDVSMKDYDWDLSTPITAGKHTLRISTAAGGQPHEIVIVKLAEGKTAQDFMGWAEKMDGAPPIEALHGIAVMQPGQVNYQTVEFKAGKYAFVCFVPDAADGRPHFLHGMVKEMTVQ